MLGSSARPRSGALFILAEIDGCFDFSSLGFEKKVAELAESIKQIRSPVLHFQREGRRQNSKEIFNHCSLRKNYRSSMALASSIGMGRRLSMSGVT